MQDHISLTAPDRTTQPANTPNAPDALWTGTGPGGLANSGEFPHPSDLSGPDPHPDTLAQVADWLADEEDASFMDDWLDGRIVSVGPLLVIFPEIALLASPERVRNMTLSILNWPGPVFVLRGHGPAGTGLAHQLDCLDAIEEGILASHVYAFTLPGRDGTDPETDGGPGMTDALRMLIAHRAFRAACARGSVSICGALRDRHLRRVQDLLEGANIRTAISHLAITIDEIAPDASAPTDAALLARTPEAVLAPCRDLPPNRIA